MATGNQAILNNTRLNAFRLNYAPTVALRATKISIKIDGVEARQRIRVDGFTIHDQLNDAPNTCSFTIYGDTTPPQARQSVRVTINELAPLLLFNGWLDQITETYEGRPETVMFHCQAVDDLQARANRRLPFGQWDEASASIVAHEIIELFGAGLVTANHVVAGLDPVSVKLDGSEGMSGAINQLARLIGGYYYFEDGDLHLFRDPEPGTTPDPLDEDHCFLDEPALELHSDGSQLRTRVYGKGHAETLLSAVNAGETILPVSNASEWFFGGRAISEDVRFRYTSVEIGGQGSLVGPGVFPSVAPNVTPASGSGLATGLYRYAYTDTTAAGESLPSPLATVSIGTAIADPANPPYGGYTNLGTGGPYPFNVGDATRAWAYTFVTAAGETRPSPSLVPGLGPLGPGGPYYVRLELEFGPPGTTARRVYRTAAGGAQLKLVSTVADNTTVVYEDKNDDSALGVNAPSSNTTGGNQALITGVAIGASPTTGRKIYRTAVNGSQLKLLPTGASFTNNSFTGPYTDAAADGSLGANVPVSDTSGLTPISGQVNAGSSSILTTSPAPFQAAGGWALAGSQAIRYRGITGNSLTGIPTTGPGSIATTIMYGDSITALPSLRGIPTSTAPAVTVRPLTMMARVRPSGFVPNAVILTLEAFATGAGYYLRTEATGTFPHAQEYNGAAVVSSTSATALEIGESFHVAGTWSGATNYVYVDGVQAAGATAVSPAPPGIDFFGHGRAITNGSPFYEFAGSVIEVAVWNVVLTPAEIASIASGAALPSAVQPGALVYYQPTGVRDGEISRALVNGAPVNVFVQRDDLDAQAELAAIDDTDGIVEYLVVDERRNETSLTAVCDAHLAMFSRPIHTLTYATRDVKTKSGKPIAVNLSKPAIAGTLTIQDVTIAEIDLRPGLAPRFTVTASSIRFSLEEILRRLTAKTGANL